MRIFFLAAISSFFFLNAQPFSSNGLITACRNGKSKEVMRLLDTTHPKLQVLESALNAALDNKHLKIAELFLTHRLAPILVKKSLHEHYARYGFMDVALWILQHGYGPLYQSRNPS